MKLVLLAVVCLAALCTAKFAEEHYQSEFINWQRNHNKAFTADEFLTRFGNFKAMYDFIQEHNSQNRSWTVGLNEFSHLSSAEFKRIYLINLSQAPRGAAPEFTGEGQKLDRAATVDWRTRGAVNPIRNQGSCGSCWAFASVAALEGAWKVKTGRLPSPLSEQQVLDCTTTSSCSGGWPYDGIDYVRRTGGINRLSDYPYQTAKGSCRYNANLSAATASGAVYVANNEASVLTAVTNQPTVVCIDAGRPSFQSYKTGVYDDTSCTTTINHAVTAVGYGSDSGDYWIIKNSWGTGWGNAGYFNLRRGVNRCGVATQVVYATTTGIGNKV